MPDPPAAGPLPKGFETPEKLEFREQNYDRAIEALRPLTEQAATRAEAWLRIARMERRRNHPEAALAAYDRMWRETAVSPEGVPYALLAAGARCELLGAAATEPLRAALLACSFFLFWLSSTCGRVVGFIAPLQPVGCSSPFLSFRCFRSARPISGMVLRIGC